MSRTASIEIYQGRRPELGEADVRVVIDVIRAFTIAHVALRRIRGSQAADKFLDPARSEFRAEDIDYCARRDDAAWAMTASETVVGLAIRVSTCG